jgi:hypothetical protein
MVVLLGQIGVAVPQALAQSNKDPYTLLEPLPCVQGQPGNGSSCAPGQLVGTQSNPINLNEYLVYAFNLVIGLAAVAAVFMIVLGGFEYMTTDAWSKKEEGKKRLTNAIVGLLMVLTSYLILKTVNPKLVDIPSTIVPPIQNLNTGSNLANSLFDQLLADAQTFNASGQQLIDEAKAAKAKNADLESKKAALQLSLIDGSAIVNGQSQADIDSQIAGNKATVIVDTAKSVMDNGGVSQTLQNLAALHLNDQLDVKKIDEQVAKGTAFIDSKKTTYDSALSQIGAYTQQQSIDEKAAEDKVALQLSGITAKVNAESSGIWWLPGVHYAPGSGLLGYNTLSSYKKGLNSQLDSVESQMSSVNDAAANQKLKDQIAATRTKISNL